MLDVDPPSCLGHRDPVQQPLDPPAGREVPDAHVLAFRPLRADQPAELGDRQPYRGGVLGQWVLLTEPAFGVREHLGVRAFRCCG